MALAAGALVVGGASVASADAEAEGVAVGSPGVLSGNVVQIPIHIPINLCGNSISVIGALNPAAGNVCVND
ncbi:chaplin [Streptomyces sp. A1136]|nr:chaplin [Streptomyces sp. A1136]